MAGASPLADDLDGVKRLEDAGAAAIVLRSLFEEQITREQMSEYDNLESHAESFAEAASYFPSPDAFALGPFEYLNHLRRAKEAVAHSRHGVAERRDAGRLDRIRPPDGSKPARTRWS